MSGMLFQLRWKLFDDTYRIKYFSSTRDMRNFQRKNLALIKGPFFYYMNVSNKWEQIVFYKNSYFTKSEIASMLRKFEGEINPNV
jgi:hypothetical protein